MAEKLIRFPEVLRRIGLTRGWVYKMVKKGLFPRPIKTGAHSVAFVESEIDAWIDAQISKASKGATPEKTK